MSKARSLVLFVLLASPLPATAQRADLVTFSAARPEAHGPDSAATAFIPNAPRLATDTIGACTGGLGPAHDDLTGPYTDFARVAELLGASPLQPRLIRRASDESSLGSRCGFGEGTPWDSRAEASRFPALGTGADWSLGIIPPRIRMLHVSAYPTDRNNGALWTGRGFNVAFTTGVTGRWRRISVRFAPDFLFHENRGFERIEVMRPPGYSPYIYPWHPGRIDWPQQPGEQSFSRVAPGQNHIRFDGDRLSFGVSTENLWWGPALHNPLVLSNTAPGFPHLFLGSRAPISTPIGDVEAQLIWGELYESDHFDGITRNDRRAIGGFIVDLQPRPIPGLFLGFARAHVATAGPDGLSAIARVGQPFAAPASRHEIDGRTPSYRLLSLFARWAPPGSGFEAWVEWASDAAWNDLADFVREPERGQAYTLGVQRAMPLGERWLRVYGELSHLTGSTRLAREGGNHAFYTDPNVPQGHTHRGQLLGAFIGPGADAQLLGADLYGSRGRVGLFLERIRRDEDAFYAIHAPFYATQRGHDVELIAGFRHLIFLPHFDLNWSVGYGHRTNRGFIDLDRFKYDFRSEGNWSVDIELHLRIDGPTRQEPPPPVTAAEGG